MPCYWKDDGTSFSQTLLNKRFLEAAGKGDFDTIHYCLDNGADPHYSNCHKETAFYLAACSGHVEVLKLLQTFNIDFAKTTVLGRNALHAALAANQSEVVKYILSEYRKESFDTITEDGWSVLSLACNYATAEVVNLLLKSGYGLDLPTQCSTLHWAVLRGNIQIVKLVLLYGAEKNKKYNGCTPLHFALDNYGLPQGTDKKSLSKVAIRLELIRLLITNNCKLHCEHCKSAQRAASASPCKCVNKQLLGYAKELRAQRRELLNNREIVKLVLNTPNKKPTPLPTTTTPLALKPNPSPGCLHAQLTAAASRMTAQSN